MKFVNSVDITFVRLAFRQDKTYEIHRSRSFNFKELQTQIVLVSANDTLYTGQYYT